MSVESAGAERNARESATTAFDPDGLPEYAALPEIPGLGVRHSWGLLPESSGALAFLSASAVRDAAALVSEGVVVPLNLNVAAFDPPLFRRAALQHSVTGDRNELEDILNNFNPQSSSQLDGLAHVRAREFGFYGGILDTEEARRRVGMHHWADRGVVGRGVLLDVVRSRRARGVEVDPFAGYPVDAQELELVAREQDVSIQAGDVLLVHTGWVERYLTCQAEGTDLTSAQRSWAGVSGDEATAAFAWNSRIAAIGADNPAVEDAPGDAARGSLHRRLLPGLGIPLFELLKLSDLARHCGKTSRWTFLFVASPLAVTGAVSSPANAIAIL